SSLNVQAPSLPLFFITRIKRILLLLPFFFLLEPYRCAKAFSMDPFLRKISAPWPILVQAATWTVLLMLTVGFASLAPEMAFVSTLSSSSNLCGGERDGLVRIPMDLPGEMVCVPSEMVKRSTLDLFVPTIFAGVMVVASVSLIRSCFEIESDV
ncbi:unnamed protein product, partial [Brassica rapa subsp. narinosa]